MTIGNILSVSIMFTLTQMLPTYYGFGILAFLQIAWIIIIFISGMITEPKAMTEREEKKINKKSFFWENLFILETNFESM